MRPRKTSARAGGSVPAETDVIEHEVRVNAPPATVFAYFTDPAKMVQWMGVEATLDPRPGGVSRIAVNSEAIMQGEFLEVVPPRRVVFSWGWEDRRFDVPPASTVVEVSLTPDADGTRVRLTHRRLPETGIDFHRVGWDYYLARLGLAASGRDPGPDPWADAEASRVLLKQWGES
jgi:uncharacterized protein YndB with AHSA1/START domain